MPFLSKWHATSPLTRNPLRASELAPNRALKEAIESTIKETGIIPESRPNIHGKLSKSSDQQVQLLLSINTDESSKVLISAKPSEGTKRTPVDIACVIDVSGSMETIATFQNEKGNTESHGLTILDIVKHAVETIIHTLEPNDRLSIIAYSSTAEVITPLTWMNKSGKKTSSTKLKTLKPLAATNLWDGLFSGMEILRNNQEEGRLGSVFILTDGMPNIAPPRGHLPMLKRYIQRHKWECIISSFGFGYSMDSKLLHELAIQGDGMYAFIPDSGFVGTTFVNALSNLLVTQAKNVKLNVEVADGYKIVSQYSKSSIVKTTPKGIAVQLGTLHYGQSRDFVVDVAPVPGKTPTSGETIVHATLQYQPTMSSEILEIPGSIAEEHDATEIQVQSFRQELAETIIPQVNKKTISESRTLVQVFASKLKNSGISNDFMRGLTEDVEGQITEAVSKLEFFEKWGEHYLPSLGRAHQIQQCNNFKDPGIQFYGGDLFNEIRDIGDDIFISLPPPVPTGVTETTSYGTKRTSKYSAGYIAPAPVSMNAYYCSSNPCFSGDSLVSMADGTRKPCNEIKKGHMVRTGNGNIAKILCVVKTLCLHEKADLVCLDGGIKITPYHPVRINGKWKFPIDIAAPREMDCDSVFSYVLDNHHSMVINDTECVTLGHGFSEDVVAHPYFGSTLVVDDLKNLSGWNFGMIVFNPGCMLKDVNTHLVCAFNPSAAVAISCEA